jgi:two-component system OmpR family response regulator
MVRKLDETLSSKRSRVLLIEDEPLISDEICYELKRRGYESSLAENFEDGRRAALLDEAGLVVLDRMLHDIDGLAIVETMREKGITTPVLILSGLTSIDERIKGLRSGGDDYLIKPFAMGELMARIDVLVRRGAEARTTRLRAGPLEIDLVDHTVRRKGRLIDLLPREFKILEYFMRRPNQPIAREALLKDVWNLDTWRHTNVVDVHLSNLRRKIDVAGEPPLIVNVRGAGFVLQADNDEPAPSRRADRYLARR